jgi:hypothetical protein
MGMTQAEMIEDQPMDDLAQDEIEIHEPTVYDILHTLRAVINGDTLAVSERAGVQAAIEIIEGNYL